MGVERPPPLWVYSQVDVLNSNSSTRASAQCDYQGSAGKDRPKPYYVVSSYKREILT
ncbi:hypothetical protein YC2023_084320 [Brassica napus]